MNPSFYSLLDSGHFKKLERVGSYKLIRPSAQACWRPRLPETSWQDADVEFVRQGASDGQWRRLKRAMPDEWSVDGEGGLRLLARLTDFGHIGIFPEHRQLWPKIHAHMQALSQAGVLSQSENSRVRVMNLFAYTGSFSLYCAKAGAEVLHLDASKTSIDWARRNAAASMLAEAPIRWMLEDALKFAAREERRGSRYHIIILDPPSFGRGPKGEVWKIEEHLPPLLDSLARLLDESAGLCLLSCHTPGYTPLTLENMLRQSFGTSGALSGGELFLEPESSPAHAPTGGGFVLPSGCYAALERGSFGPRSSERSTDA